MFKTLKYTQFIILLLLAGSLMAQKPYRVGTTACNFLENGVGSDGLAMGDAFVSIPGRMSSTYWNPAGLAHLEGSEFLFMNQPWLVDIENTAFAAAYVLPGIGTISASILNIDYGDIPVTSLDLQDGTGELYTASEYAFSLGFSRKLVQWFSFGANLKYISSQMWHMKASAAAVDMGALVNTGFFSFSGRVEDGIRIGMSISNYGTRIRYDGIDGIFPIDILADEYGNFKDVPGQFKMSSWELPLIFRIGASIVPINNRLMSLTLAADALHPNNNSESVNLGAEYQLKLGAAGSLYARAGYKGLYMDESIYGSTFGGGMEINLLGNSKLRADYAMRSMDILGNIEVYTFGIVSGF